MKIDVLALGMLTCIRKAFDLATKLYGSISRWPTFLRTIRLCMKWCAMLIRSGCSDRKPGAAIHVAAAASKMFYDLVIEVAIVRPGPIQGDMVHPYLRRRNGEEPIDYPSKDLEDILADPRHSPVPGAGDEDRHCRRWIYSAEADELRRSMATFKAKG